MHAEGAKTLVARASGKAVALCLAASLAVGWAPAAALADDAAGDGSESASEFSEGAALSAGAAAEDADDAAWAESPSASAADETAADAWEGLAAALDAAADAASSGAGSAEAEDADGATPSAAGTANGSSAAAEEETVSSDADGSSSSTASASLSVQKFIAVIAEPARAIAQENDLYASVMIAQAVVESASGSSALASAPNYNLFGVKGSYQGQSVTLLTQEDDGTGTLHTVEAAFRQYPSYAASLRDYAQVMQGEAYSGARRSQAGSWEQACQALQGVYATDTSYAAKLAAVIQANGLQAYDDPLPYKLASSYQVSVLDSSTGAVTLEERTLVDVVEEATSHLGDAYVWGGAAPGGFDCSGLVQYCYGSALGIALPRTSYEQYEQGSAVGLDELHMGDLLFFFDEDGAAYHVALYLAQGCYIYAPEEGDVVKVGSIAEWAPDAARRIVETVPVEEEGAVQTVAIRDGSALWAEYRMQLAVAQACSSLAGSIASGQAQAR